MFALGAYRPTDVARNIGDSRARNILVVLTHTVQRRSMTAVTCAVILNSVYSCNVFDVAIFAVYVAGILPLYPRPPLVVFRVLTILTIVGIVLKCVTVIVLSRVAAFPGALRHFL